MKISLTQISISDRVNAAKLAPQNTDTSAVPMAINPSPGPSSIQPIDTTSIDSAGNNVNQQTQSGNKATSDSMRKGNNPANQNLQYDKQSLSSEDQAPTAKDTTNITQTPQPKSKGFRESLIDAQMGNVISNNSGGEHTVDRDYGHNNGNPNEGIKEQPDSQPIRRTQQTPYDNSGNKVKEPAAFPITSFDKTNNVTPYKAPEQNLGPQYAQKSIKQPTPRFNTPRINSPRFN